MKWHFHFYHPISYSHNLHPMNQPVIEIDQLSKSYQPGIPVLNNISLTIPKGEFVTIIGPSGCGKTTLLRLINAMTGYNNGILKVMGKDLIDWNKIELRRRIGYVIQQGGLFPHLSVRQNMEFVLKTFQNRSKHY
jgi:osmoprotectant transport system ATP-binding protein